MSINPARFDAKFKNLSAIAQKVFNAVPINEIWSTNRIHAELQHHGVSRNLNVTKGCLNTLVSAGFIAEPQRGCFTQSHVRAKPEDKPPLQLVTSQQPQPPKEPMSETTTSNDATKTRKKPFFLTTVESADLVNLIRGKYTESGLSDLEFANLVRDKINPGLNASHVTNRRDDLKIPNNTSRQKSSDTETLLAMIEALEARVAALEAAGPRLP